ncbi:MAG: MBL fold metallo-hydrolase [Chloroflexota bacterium]|nr:MBL fold metallo-hydrolase [Chloroflexota bacterium]
MYFKQFLNERLGCASYFIASRQSHEAAVVDPSVDLDEYESLLRERGFLLKYVINTHVHADHISGARQLAARHGAELCLHEVASVSYPFRTLRDGDELELGQLRLRIMHTPGHRPELISVLIVNPPRSPEASMVLTGDSLLVGDVGRPDFGGGDAAAQYDSVTRLLQLPDWVAVFPGHFEGPCGKGMCGRPTTTIGFERLYNPLVRLDREPFVDALTGSVAARPLNITAIEATNRGAADLPWAMLSTWQQVDEVGIEALDTKPPESLLLDVREPEEYAQGHIPGAVNLPQADLATSLARIPRDRQIYSICWSGARSLRAAQFLKQMGYQSIVSVRGGTSAWLESGRPVEGCGDTETGREIVETEWMHAGGGSPSARSALLPN